MSCEQLFDKLYQLYYTVKRPAPETRSVSIDFKKLLTGVASINSVTILPQGKTANGSPLTYSGQFPSGTLAVFTISAGTDLEDYIIEVNVTDSANSNNKPTGRILVKVRVNDYDV